MIIPAVLTLIGIALGAAAPLLSQALSGRQSLRLTAAERRLQAQQDAFAKWWKLAVSRLDDGSKRRDAIVECQDFWNKNCLFLGRKTRKAFRETLVDFAACDYGGRPLEPLGKDIEKVFRIIMAEADLPDLNESFVDVQQLLKKDLK